MSGLNHRLEIWIKNLHHSKAQELGNFQFPFLQDNYLWKAKNGNYTVQTKFLFLGYHVQDQ